MSDRPLRVGTWNVAYGIGQERNARRRAEMRVHDVDVWVLTETNDVLTPGDGYSAVHSVERPRGSRDVVSGSRWVSIWSRLPILPAVMERADDERTAACIVELSDASLLVYGTVLPWYNDVERRGMRAELAKQAPEWAALPVDHDAVGCVAGDFNANIGGPHYYGSTDSKLAIAEYLAAAKLTLVTRFENTKRFQSDFGVIDHIAIGDEVAVSAKVVAVFDQPSELGEKLSDHTGVVVEIDALLVDDRLGDR